MTEALLNFCVPPTERVRKIEARLAQIEERLNTPAPSPIPAEIEAQVSPAEAAGRIMADRGEQGWRTARIEALEKTLAQTRAEMRRVEELADAYWKLLIRSTVLPSDLSQSPFTLPRFGRREDAAAWLDSHVNGSGCGVVWRAT